MTDSNRLQQNMTDYPFIADRRMKLTNAYDFIKGCKIRHLPIVEGGEVVGIVSDRDLKQALSFSDAEKLIVEDVMTLDPYVVSADEALSVVAHEMAERKIGSSIVVSRQNQILGIFTTTDALRLLSQLLRQSAHKEMGLRAIEGFTGRHLKEFHEKLSI